MVCSTRTHASCGTALLLPVSCTCAVKLVHLAVNVRLSVRCVILYCLLILHGCWYYPKHAQPPGITKVPGLNPFRDSHFVLEALLFMTQGTDRHMLTSYRNLVLLLLFLDTYAQYTVCSLIVELQQDCLLTLGT